MSRVRSTVVRCAKVCSIKKLIVVAFVVGVLAVNWWLRDDPPIEDRCSPSFPEFTVQLDFPTTLPDGRVQVSNGVVYGPDAVFTEDGVTMGCPCSGDKPCVRKCCPEGQGFDYHYRCIETPKIPTLTDFANLLDVYRLEDGAFNSVNVSEHHFSVLTNHCPYARPLPAPFTFKYLCLLEDGVIQNEIFGSVFDQGQYCMDTWAEGSSMYEPFVIPCSLTPERKQFEETRLYRRNFVFYAIRVVNVVINIFSLLVFMIIPQLRGGCGKSIMCYLLTRIYSSMDDILNITRQGLAGKHSHYCTVLGPLALLSTLAQRSWQFIIAYQIWSAFSPSPSKNRSNDFKDFLVFLAFGWGTPFAVMMIAVLSDLISWVPAYFKPNFGVQQCWFNNSDAQWMYYQVPYFSVELAVMALTVATLFRLHSAKKTSSALQGSESQRHSRKEIKWSQVYMKACFLMGVNYALFPIAGIVSRYYPLSRFIKISTLNIDDMRGAEVLFVFILKKDILTQLLQKITFWRKADEQLSRS